MSLLRVLIRALVTPARPARAPRSRDTAPTRQDPPRAQSQTVVVTSTTVSVQVQVQVVHGAAWVIDGDTIEIKGMRLRLFGIDAPELDHPWGQKSRWALVALCKGQTIRAELSEDVTHDRRVARCYLPDGRDLSAELVKAGMALDWPKFSGGIYRHLEPPDIRRKLWRADARQKGRMPPS